MSDFSFDLINKEFQLDKTSIFLNHGSFGACPKPIFKEREKWQLEIEKQPVKFIEDRAITLLDWSRSELANFVKCDKDDLVYFPNPTTAMNMVIKSLKLDEGDEVISSNHEYGGVERIWKYMQKKTKFSYNQIDIPVPFNKDGFLERFKQKISKKTKVIFISHITSPTGIVFPIKELCDLMFNYTSRIV